MNPRYLVNRLERLHEKLEQRRQDFLDQLGSTGDARFALARNLGFEVDPSPPVEMSLAELASLGTMNCEDLLRRILEGVEY